MNVNFTKEEKIELLKKIGYSIETVPSWETEWDFDEGTTYDISVNVEIAVREANFPSEELLKRQARFLERKFGVDVIFYLELKKRIKELFLNPTMSETKRLKKRN